MAFFLHHGEEKQRFDARPLFGADQGHGNIETVVVREVRGARERYQVET